MNKFGRLLQGFYTNQGKVFLLLFALGILSIAQPTSGQDTAEKQIEKDKIFLNFEKFENMNFANRIDGLTAARLTIRILPIKTCAIYVTYPDGGSMLINTGNAGDAKELIQWVTEEFGKLGVGCDLIKVLGWKPRVDWIVITSSHPNYSGGLSEIMKKIEVKQVFVPKGMDISLPKDVTLIELEENDDIDLMQIISKVELSIIRAGKFQRNTGSPLSLRLSYLNYNIVFVLNEFSSRALEEFGKTIKNATIFTDRSLSDKATTLIKPALVVPMNEKITAATDGLRFYLENITPELKQEIEAKQIEGMYKEAQKCYSKEYYKSVVRITDKILSRKANNKPVKVLNLMARAQMFFTIKKYDLAQNELSKVLEIEPNNKEAKMLLIRIETVMKMMPGR